MTTTRRGWQLTSGGHPQCTEQSTHSIHITTLWGGPTTVPNLQMGTLRHNKVRELA